jgi:hypothetical protein
MNFIRLKILHLHITYLSHLPATDVASTEDRDGGLQVQVEFVEQPPPNLTAAVETLQ